MQMMIGDIEKAVETYKKEMRDAGLVSYTLTQVWNKQGKFRLGQYWSYKDEKAFITC